LGIQFSLPHPVCTVASVATTAVVSKPALVSQLSRWQVPSDGPDFTELPKLSKAFVDFFLNAPII
jgi:hypothetical protein